MKIGVDGGGTKTELILTDDAGNLLTRHLTSGCNPSVLGPAQARLVLTDALCSLLGPPSTEPRPRAITHTLLCMAGARAFWQETAAALTQDGHFGQVTAVDDSLPVLEVATAGGPGLGVHAGTGSFVAARGRDGSVHYAGGLGWRFGDPGSGYDIGRRAISRALLELQGWAPPSRLGPTLRDHTGHTDAQSITRHFYNHAEPNRAIGAFAPHVVRLAAEGDHTAHQLVVESAGELLHLAVRVATQLFPDRALDSIRTGISGPILTQPSVLAALAPLCPLPLQVVTDAPIEGVRRLLTRAEFL